MKRLFLVFITLFFVTATANGKEADLKLVKVTTDVYAIVGSLGNRSKQNLGNNATFGVVVTKAGVVLIDSGATYEAATKIHHLIKTITKLPVKIVINSGGQDHRWLGNDYFKKQGAKIIASIPAVADQKARQQDQFFMLGNILGDKGIKKTNPVYADETFDAQYSLSLGGTELKIIHAGSAHTPGDSFVWLPQHKAVFAGDIVYVERMLGVLGFSNSKTWLQAFEKIIQLKAKHVIPGHGQPTTIEVAKKDTYDYLIFLRKKVSEFINVGGGIENIGNLDQSKYSYLKNYKTLKGRNAQQVFQELEFE